MSKKLDICVIGLGNFGLSLAETLTAIGHKVLGMDTSESRVKHSGDMVYEAVQADATDREALLQLGIQDFNHVAVCIGKMEESILATLNLKELGAENIWVMATGVAHEKILSRLGATWIIFPERDVARQTGHRMALPGLVNYLPLGGGVVLREIPVKDWAGKTLRELDLTNTYKVQVVAIKHEDSEEFHFIPRADEPLDEGATLVVIGDAEHMQALGPLPEA